MEFTNILRKLKEGQLENLLEKLSFVYSKDEVTFFELYQKMPQYLQNIIENKKL